MRLPVLRLALSMQDVGEREGKYYSLNVPLKDGIDDQSFVDTFQIVSDDSREDQPLHCDKPTFRTDLLCGHSPCKTGRNVLFIEKFIWPPFPSLLRTEALFISIFSIRVLPLTPWREERGAL